MIQTNALDDGRTAHNRARNALSSLTHGIGALVIPSDAALGAVFTAYRQDYHDAFDQAETALFDVQRCGIDAVIELLGFLEPQSGPVLHQESYSEAMRRYVARTEARS